MKRRNFIKGLLAGASAAPVILKAKPAPKIKKIGTGRTARLVEDRHPREGDVRLLPLEGTPVLGNMRLCDAEEAPQYETFLNGRWVRNAG